MVKLIFALKVLFYIFTDFHFFFVALFTTFGMQKDKKDHVLLEMLENKMIFKKAVSKGWCKESRI